MQFWIFLNWVLLWKSLLYISFKKFGLQSYPIIYCFYMNAKKKSPLRCLHWHPLTSVYLLKLLVQLILSFCNFSVLFQGTLQRALWYWRVFAPNGIWKWVAGTGRMGFVIRIDRKSLLFIWFFCDSDVNLFLTKTNFNLLLLHASFTVMCTVGRCNFISKFLSQAATHRQLCIRK